LTVNSSNPNSGVTITVSPPDNTSAGSGTTPFTRTYNANTPVNLTAPATAGANNFQKWLKDNQDFPNNTLTGVRVTMDTNHTMTAVYVTPSAPLAPVATAATSITTTSFTANWNSSAGATDYHLDVSTSNTFASFVTGYQDLDVGNTLSQSVTGLSAG